ncbi:MAG: NAD(P)-dependent oxidoreductase [Acidobacteriota bacterium]|nr:NAD(P)-dependent oxidoreductase [Acidobacteriota bacterium]
MKVVYHSTAGKGVQSRFASLEEQGIFVTSCAESDRDRLKAVLADADVLWHLLEPVTADAMALAPRLQLIQKIGVGVNTIDLDAARQRNIAVCNMPGTNSQAVAEMTLLLMLTTLRRVNRLDHATRMGKTQGLTVDLQDESGEICGRTIGLVGYGAVPRLLAPVLKAMGASVVYTCPQAKADALGDYRSFAELLAVSDVVSLHVPLTANTDKMVNEVAIKRMKPGAILINTSRGGVVDEEALRRALGERRLAAAGLDVFASEPLGPDDPLLSLDNVVVTPHVAYLTAETMVRSIRVAAENCRRLVSKEELLHRVV